MKSKLNYYSTDKMICAAREAGRKAYNIDNGWTGSTGFEHYTQEHDYYDYWLAGYNDARADDHTTEETD